jgi:preprotein translocase subunit SecA
MAGRGTTSVEISELLSRMLKMRGIAHNVLNAKMHKSEAEIVAEAGKPGVVTIATNMAGRGTDIKITEEVRAAGGLAIIGTERHDSRRVDRQLRGRSGRQGDVGSSQFYVSLEDNLMRLFGSERVAKVMDRMGLKEGEVIQHSMMTKSIERAQKRVEENNFGVRKRLLEYDDVMNSQREVVYKRRRHALEGERLKVDIVNMIYDTCEVIVENNKMVNDFKNFEFELIRTLSISSPVSEAEFMKLNNAQITAKVYQAAYAYYEDKVKRDAHQAFPVIKDVYENNNGQYERIVVPFTDGIKTLNVVTNLDKAYQTEGKSLITDFEKNITLAIVDESWKKHLRKMDELKQSVQLAVHEQKDPLLIYKFEAFELFKKMIEQVNKDVISFLFKGELPSYNANNFNDGTTIATIADMNDMIFEGKIDETEVGRVHEGMPIVLTVGALQDKKFNATLEYISPKGVEENGAVMFEMKAAARIPDSVEIRAGYSANAEIILDQRKDVLTIPESAVSFENDSAFVYVLKKTKDKTQTFDKKFVELGLSDGINIQVVKGVVDSMEIRGLQKVETEKTPTPPAK